MLRCSARLHPAGLDRRTDAGDDRRQGQLGFALSGEAPTLESDLRQRGSTRPARRARSPTAPHRLPPRRSRSATASATTPISRSRARARSTSSSCRFRPAARSVCASTSMRATRSTSRSRRSSAAVSSSANVTTSNGNDRGELGARDLRRAPAVMQTKRGFDPAARGAQLHAVRRSSAIRATRIRSSSGLRVVGDVGHHASSATTFMAGRTPRRRTSTATDSTTAAGSSPAASSSRSVRSRPARHPSAAGPGVPGADADDGPGPAPDRRLRRSVRRRRLGADPDRRTDVGQALVSR